MAFDPTALLLHSDDVPAQAKLALKAARHAPEAMRAVLLETAASALYWKSPLACDEARELVGLPPGTCG